MLPLLLCLAQWPFKFWTRIVKPSDELETLFFCVMTIVTKRTNITNMALVTNMTSVKKNMTNIISETMCDRLDKV